LSRRNARDTLARTVSATVPEPTPAGRDPLVLARMRRLRWTAFGLVGAAYVLSFFHRIAPSAIAGELRAAFGASSAELGAVAAMYFVVYTPMQVPTGVLVDALGPRRVVALGGLVAGAGSIAFGAAHGLGTAAVGRGLVGLGVSVAFIALLKLVGAWFHEREFATLSGLVMFMGNLGAALAATPLAWVVGVTSWRNVFVGIGVSSIAGATLTWLFVRDDPVHAGLPSMRELEGKPPHARHAGSPWAGLAQVARNRATWPGFFVNLGIGGTFLAFAGLWAVPYLVGAHGLSRDEAAVHSTVMLVAFAFGSLGIGKLSDRLRRRKPLMLALGAAYTACWVPWLAGWALGAPARFAVFAVMGLTASAFTLSWASVKEVNAPALSGTAMAVVNTGVFLGPSVYQPLVGWVLDRSAWPTALAVLAACAAGGVLAVPFVRETYARNVTVR
jgi:sugar phosphate permease